MALAALARSGIVSSKVPSRSNKIASKRMRGFLEGLGFQAGIVVGGSTHGCHMRLLHCFFDLGAFRLRACNTRQSDAMTAVLKKQRGIPQSAIVGDFYDRSVALLATFRKIMEGEAVAPLYQPIVDLQTAEIMGYEGLIRGPENSSLHSPLALFNVARMCGETVELESLCCKVHIENFALLALPGKLFLNMSPDVFLLPTSEQHPLVEPFAVALLDV